MHLNPHAARVILGEHQSKSRAGQWHGFFPFIEDAFHTCPYRTPRVDGAQPSGRLSTMGKQQERVNVGSGFPVRQECQRILLFLPLPLPPIAPHLPDRMPSCSHEIYQDLEMLGGLDKARPRMLPCPQQDPIQQSRVEIVVGGVIQAVRAVPCVGQCRLQGMLRPYPLDRVGLIRRGFIRKVQHNPIPSPRRTKIGRPT